MMKKLIRGVGRSWEGKESVRVILIQFGNNSQVVTTYRQLTPVRGIIVDRNAR